MKLSKTLTSSACVAAIAIAAPATAQDSHQWANFHWDNAGDGFSLDVRYNFANPVWETYIGPAYVKWQDVIPGGGASKMGVTYTADPSIDTGRCRPIAGKIVICSDTYGFRRGGWLGVATAWTDDLGHFQQVTVQYNDTFYNGTYNDPLEREYVTCHEQGHSIGLGHRDENFSNENVGSCMDYTNDVDGGGSFGPSNLYPDSIDAGVLNSVAMYGTDHDLFDHSGGDDSSGPGGGGGPPDGKGPKKLDHFTFRIAGQPAPQSALYPEWGAIIGYDGFGRPNEFLQLVAPGLTKRTHVFWSREARPAGMR